MKKKKAIKVLAKKVIELDVTLSLLIEALAQKRDDKLVNNFFKKINE